MNNCLIIDKSHESLVSLLQKINVVPDYRPDILPEEILAVIHEYEGLIVRSKMKVDSTLLDKATRLRYVARAGAGVDQIDEQALEERGIALLNAPEGNRDAVGEQTVGMLLCLLNHLHIADRGVRQKEWLREENRGTELGDKTVGLIGYGNMGQAFAKRLSGFGCRVIAFDKYRKDYGDQFATEVSLETLFTQTDILSFHIPLTEETCYMADIDFFNRFKKNIYLLNTARGKIAPFKALAEGLRSGKLIGLALDVLENENLPTLTEEQQTYFDYLSKSDRVLLTPHIAGWTFESYTRINEVLVEKINQFLSTTSS